MNSKILFFFIKRVASAFLTKHRRNLATKLLLSWSHMKKQLENNTEWNTTAHLYEIAGLEADLSTNICASTTLSRKDLRRRHPGPKITRFLFLYIYFYTHIFLTFLSILYTINFYHPIQWIWTLFLLDNQALLSKPIKLTLLLRSTSYK